VSTDNVGELLRLLGTTDNLTGGQLEVNGRSRTKGRDACSAAPSTGRTTACVNAPLFARLLSVASFSGIAGLLSGDGIVFKTAQGGFHGRGRRVEVKEGHAYGGAIGINAGGTFDIAANTLEVAGTLVPANTLNTVLGDIPVLGKILLGGEGEGIFAANFRIAGPVSDPRSPSAR